MVAGVVSAAMFASALTARQVLNRTSYEVAKVVDGDTFDTSEKQIVRLASVLAPEWNQCAGNDAKSLLEKLVFGKKVYMKVIFRDNFRRLISVVYTKEGSVNLKMIASGMAYFGGGYDYGGMREATREAKAKKLGIYSPECVQDSNPKQPKCVIKGNVKLDSPVNLYRFPGCGQYNNTQVELSKGDQWFCTEAEAQKAGFTKGSDCFDKTWHPGQ
ncbi:MAG: Micrococcal nuclease-like protein nuclease [Candidatus Amesbacteria bacterium GW2011_GWA2_47_11b]|uniref:Micrococcal nuclease-like protein nuclease n=3 Tax=Candidatus Amesiibacteriota TaxID=1752730 RepID=A0A0G1SKA0_9BACT|nr:MAG: Micrococcal nuclease-like protein nuclease [Microgenomates group bacterium GW2011_GWC1_46_20]KKU57554.1 MAG: Micrococcal nuclease-like protein nuclease [Candidatus Amesbacteria bacterium GW2011_GWA2_47_11b]KKU69841.1 MAG: Micrococcal nuclease-like protein nuclease [Candidatus Amesbacteria bacterium GW2011_GWA1_47_20]KKU84652.1 MAG: Micrococcal nuclease-like protein nuclease [Candidatus Amesbacteria bacterium GW2011_GWC2_47_8]